VNIGYLNVYQMKLVPATFAALAVIAGMTGCASYDPAPLPRGPDLKPTLASLDVTIPATAEGPLRRIDITRPLTIDEIGLLAIINDPDLKSERGELGAARAGLVQATILPNPSANFGYGALIGGPGTTSSIAASLAQDIVPIITRGALVKAAEAHLYQVDADQLWREWQVVQKARQLALDIEAGDRLIALTQREARLIAGEIAQVQSAIGAGNLAISALSPLLAAAASAEQSLVTLRLARLKNWQELDALLDLMPSKRFAIAPPDFPPLPSGLEPVVANLSEWRPDLAALRLGYSSAEENVRAAILGQFPALTIGGAYGSDTTAVVSAGPSFTFALPIFDRNQGNIAKARATRLLLREQYQARLDSAVATIHALLAQISHLSGDLARARAAAQAAQSLAATAQQAYAQGNLDQRTLTDYETTALERAVEAITIERQIGEDRIFLSVELGLGLPQTRLALTGG
jgi:outer membrane protein, heavy metal efflux system